MKHKLKDYRLEKGMTQQEVADYLGMSFKTYSALERGYRGKVLGRSLGIILKAAKLYGRSIEDIFVKNDK